MRIRIQLIIVSGSDIYVDARLFPTFYFGGDLYLSSNFDVNLHLFMIFSVLNMVYLFTSSQV